MWVCSDDLKWSNKINQAIAKANSKLSLLLKTFTSRDKNSMKTLHCTCVRPHLEFAVPVLESIPGKRHSKVRKNTK
jgi:hypothetical protein